MQHHGYRHLYHNGKNDEGQRQQHWEAHQT